MHILPFVRFTARKCFYIPAPFTAPLYVLNLCVRPSNPLAMFSRNYLPLLGSLSLLISKVVAQNASCDASAPPTNITLPVYAFPQPFLPFLAPQGTQAFDDLSRLITYDGNWTSVADPNAVNSTLHTTNDPSASLTFTFTGTGIEWFGTTGPDHGQAKVRKR